MNFLVYLIYYLLGNKSKANFRKEKMKNLEENAISIIEEIKKFALSLNHEITMEEKNVLMKYIINFCVLSKKNKPDFNKLRYRAYNEFVKFEKDYFNNKPTIEQYVDVESYKKDLEKWNNNKPEMNYKEKLQHNNYSKSISLWKNKLDEINVKDKAYFKLSKNERVLFDEIKETIFKFPNLKDKILDLTYFLIEERDYWL